MDTIVQYITTHNGVVSIYNNLVPTSSLEDLKTLIELKLVEIRKYKTPEEKYKAAIISSYTKMRSNVILLIDGKEAKRMAKLKIVDGQTCTKIDKVETQADIRADDIVFYSGVQWKRSEWKRPEVFLLPRKREKHPLEFLNLEFPVTSESSSSSLPSSLLSFACTPPPLEEMRLQADSITAHVPLIKKPENLMKNESESSVPAASANKILVMNTPQANSRSAAELTCILILNLSRHVPQAAALMRAGKWARKDFMGEEVYGRTLAVLGLGRIGCEVAVRLQAFGMRVIGYDPIVTKEQAEAKNIELLPLEQIWPQADYITVHVPLIKQTENLINKETLAKCKKGVRVVNVARGGIVNEADLVESLNAGHAKGAAFDVFAQEPPTFRELIDHPLVISTPHLGASTIDAQLRVASEIADNIVQLNKGAVLGVLVKTNNIELLPLEQMRKQADSVTAHEPHIKQAENLMKNETTAECKKGVPTVNVACGGIVNEANLVNESAPQLGASTSATQLRVASEIADTTAQFNKGTILGVLVETTKIELLPLEQVRSHADSIKAHEPLITENLIQREPTAECKNGVPTVNVACGSIVNEANLVNESAPHLGASTIDAQLRVASEIADTTAQSNKGTILGVLNARDVLQ